MVSTLYRLDLSTLVWACLSTSPSQSPASSPETPTSATPTSGPAPQARYFHSACAWGDKLVIFGGEGYEESSPSASSSSAGGEDAAPALRTLDDVCIWDTRENRWLSAETQCKEGVERPAPRYAHLGVVTSAVVEEEGQKREKSVMLIMGGQDIRNTYLHSMNVLDLTTLTWVHASTWDRHIGTYRAVCTSPSYTVVPASVVPVEKGGEARLGLEEGEQRVQLGYSEMAKGEKPEPLLLFSNFNFTQVRRDLDLLTSPLSADPLRATSLSSSMSGPSLPPGLRFPTGTIIGRHLLVFGTFLSHTVNNFSIWALDLGPAGAGGVKERVERGEKVDWMRIDPGSTLARGSWNRAVGWGNSVVVLGDRERDIAADYDHRQTNFTHVCLIDCESFGIYQPPPRALPPLAQSFGLSTLAQPFLSDFEIVCSDGKRLACSRKVLLDRWSWFATKMEEFKQRASGVQSAQQKRVEAEANGGGSGTASAVSVDGGEEKHDGEAASDETSPKPNDLRLTPRTLSLPEPSPVVQAFLQYLYTLSLTTPLQLHPPVLAGLVVFAKTYNEAILRGLCVHALHGVLEREGATAPLVYEAATMSGCTALQIRALRTMLGNPGMRARASQPPSVQVELDDPIASQAPPAPPAPPAAPADPQSQLDVPSASASTFANRRQARTLGVGTARACGAVSTPASPLSPSFDPPSSPPPTSPLPTTPPPSSPRNLPRLPAVLPPTALESPAHHRRSLKPPSDTVAEPTPDEVSPVPVPLFSPFLPLDQELHSPSHRRSCSIKSASVKSSRRSGEGYFDALPHLLSDGEDSDTATATDSVSSPTKTIHSTSTRATSVRSRSSSVGSRGSGKESFGPHPGWQPALPAQVEEDETSSQPSSPRQHAQLSPALTASTSSFVSVSPDQPHPPPLNQVAHATHASLVSVLQHPPIPRLSLPPSLKSRRKKREPKVPSPSPSPTSEEHWTPSFFDTVKGGQGSIRSPLSTRKATSLTPELIASLDVEALAAMVANPAASVSAPLDLPAVAVEQESLFVAPRPAPRPSAADAASASTTHLVTPTAISLVESRRHCLDPSTFRSLSPHPARSPLRPSPLSSSPSIFLSASSQRSSLSSTASTLPSGGSSDSHDARMSSAAGDVLVFDPAANEMIPLVASTSSTLGQSGLPVPAMSARAKSPVSLSSPPPDSFGRQALPSTSSAILALPAAARPTGTATVSHTPSVTPARSSKLFGALHSKSTPAAPLSSKQQRQALELTIGTKVLRAAGASDAEIRLRARSVGFTVLKKHDEEVKKGKKAGRPEPSLTGALGEYAGGQELSSKFSWD
ncbi:hypothetical protein JCM10213v2_004251 [Rhodosporidiobolus nylandii]